MKTISLTQNKVTLIDDEDYELVSPHNWYASCTPNRRTTGDPPWYAVGWIGGKKILLHRYLTHARPGQTVDHIDRDGLNNQRFTNLRFISPGHNQANSAGKSTRRSQYKGVFPVPRKHGIAWRAQITVNGRDAHLGYFPTELAAAHAYDFAASWGFGRFAHFNLIPSPDAAPSPATITAYARAEDSPRSSERSSQ